MKAAYFIITLIVHTILVFTLKLLDNFYLILGIMLAGVVAGTIILIRKNAKFKNVGWGICYGSALSLIMLIVFTTWLSYNYPQQ